MTPAEAETVCEEAKESEESSTTVSVINTFTASKHLSFKLSTNDITHFLRTSPAFNFQSTRCWACYLTRQKHRRKFVFSFCRKRESETDVGGAEEKKFNLDLCTLILRLGLDFCASISCYLF